MAELSFEPPGPGSWSLNDLHFPRPVTRYRRSIPSFINSDLAREGLATYGVVMNPVVETVNGYHYVSRQPVEGTPEPGDDPVSLEELPDEPENEFQRRVRNAEETFETRRWRGDLERWDEEWKPRIRETNRRLQAVSPGDLDDEALIEHLEDCRDAGVDHGALMFRILPCAWIPQGDFLAFVRDHTDRPPEEVVTLFAGATPASRGAVEELGELVSVIEANPAAADLVRSERPPGDIIEELQGLGDGVGPAAEAWLSVVGYRIVTGFDIDGQYALERPATLVNTLRSALDGDLEADRPPEEPPNLDRVRESVPPALREEFDARYREARLTHRVQDERALLAGTTEGLTRRALLEAGRRLSERGQLQAPDHVVDLAHDEVVAALRGEPAPSAAEVAAHVRYRERHDADDAPDHLGPAPSDGLDPSVLPEPAARSMSAFAARHWADRMAQSAGEDAAVISGHGASPGTAEGTARVVDGPDDFDRIRDGDVVVTELTTPAFNVVLPMLRALVTDTGGMLSHPAIVAREFGIPAVVGCEDATERIDDGDRVVVDGGEGTVRFAAASPETEGG